LWFGDGSVVLTGDGTSLGSSREVVGEGAEVRGKERMLSVTRAPRCRVGHTVSKDLLDRSECLGQLLEAFADIADRDDIHQAAERLAKVQEWIRREAEAAAADPIFAALRLAS
jgi:hypothetical protein